MKYLVFDIECADAGNGYICSFGYVIADMDFKIIKREDIVINPESRFFWDFPGAKPTIKLAYPEATFKRAKNFTYFYEKIKALVENEEFYVVGHSVNNDAEFLNKSCQRYKLEPLNFKFYDTQRMYQDITETSKVISLENAMAEFGINEKLRFHQSVEDARATLFFFKAMLQKVNMSFEEYIGGTNRISGKNENGKAVWDNAVKRTRNFVWRWGEFSEDYIVDNTFTGKKAIRIFQRYINDCLPIGELSDKLSGRSICISLSYEHWNFKEMLVIVGLIKAAGGSYNRNSTAVNTFVTYQREEDSGDYPNDYIREAVVNGLNAEGAGIEIMTLSELLDILGVTFEELEEAEMPDVNYLIAEDIEKTKALKAQT